VENTSAATNTVNSASNSPQALSTLNPSWPELPGQSGAQLAATYWRSLHYFNFYRIALASLLLLAHFLFAEHNPLGALVPQMFVLASVLYLLLGGLLIVTIQSQWPRFDIQVSGQVFADIFLITVLMYSSGGVVSGLGLLVLVTLAASSLIARGRLAMFHAAIATIAVLFEETYLSYSTSMSGNYLQAALLSTTYFAVAGLAYYLAKRLSVSEAIAQRQRVDLANLDTVNRLVIQDMQDGVIVVDGDNRVRQINSQAERLLGPLTGRRGEITIDAYSSSLAARIAEWRDSGDISLIPLRTPGGTRSFRARITPIGTKRALGAVIFLEDLSRLQAQAQQIKLAALGRLTANIAHEIRNPLSSIGHATQLLQEDEDFDATQKRLLEIINDNTFRLDRMVQDILQLNRKDRGQPETLQLAAYLQSFNQEFSHTEHLPPNLFQIEVDPAIAIEFDRYHLHQVLWNVCRNAARHCKQQPGSIRLTANQSPAENVIQLDIIDDGPGVASANQAQLFEPFFTTESTGTGLGLYIARQLAEANNATLDYVDNPQGGQFRLCAKGVTH
jgi:two-component system sensor histidine kinase PilS (NtrC family)